MHKPAIALILTVALTAFGGASAQALTFSPCARDAAITCTTLTVPLQRGGPATNTVSLDIERQQAGSTPTHDAVLALAGGPGQAATPLAGFIAKAIAPALTTRDLIVFDQRGTGRSAPLRCKALQESSSLESSDQRVVAKLVERCARELGPGRAAFTSSETVEDIEAIRRALGYEKLVLYGTSYGTKVAELYAQTYPQNVQALVLDSVVLPEGPEVFALSTLRAITPAMTELCSRNACRGITSSPVSDIAQLAAQLRHRRLRGSVYDGSGKRHTVSIAEPDLLRILLAGDLNPALRALLPAAVRSALRHDPDPLLRLSALARGLIPNLPTPPRVPGPEAHAAEESDALFLATSCEELTFPWQLASPPQARQSEALAALRLLHTSALYPFDANTAWQDSLIPLCLGWPNTTAAPKPQNTLPDVPTLILSGAQDLRTPTANARALAQLIPDAQVEVVPYTGHSVLGSDFGGCASEAVQAFFAGLAIQPCETTNNVFDPTPVTPSKLNFIKPLPGLQGKTGRTVSAILDTMVDLSRQVIGATLQLEQELPSGSSFGGLHGGYARITSTALRLSHFSFVEGVQVTGTFTLRTGEIQPATVQISGSAAAHGTVRLGSSKSVSGILDGHRFHVSLATVKLAQRMPRDWPTDPLRSRLAGLARIH
jgi:pimeloyl-ACP methyl ester carboxylesterase